MTTKPTKKQVMTFISSLGGRPMYSGKNNTMYIASYSTKIESKVIDEFGYSLPYKLKTINMPSKISVDLQ